MIPIILYLAAMAIFAALGWHCGALSKRAATLCASVPCALLVVGAVFAKKMSWMPDWMVCDTASLLQASWYAPPAIALMALGLRHARQSALAHGRLAGSVARVGVLLAAMFIALAGAGLWDLCSRLYGPEKILAEIAARPQLSANGVVLQSTLYTCGPAACATLLRLRRIHTAASERDMIPLCRTQYQGGVSVLSLAAGLKRATMGTDWRVRLLEPSFEELDALPLPAIVTVNLTTGQGHVVVLCALESERVRVADPADKDGLTWWTMSEFKRRYLHEAVTLVRAQ